MAPALLSRLLNPNEKEVRQHRKTAAEIGELEPELKTLDDAAFLARAEELRERARNGELLDTLLVESFALTREAGRRTLGMRHFDVQLVGGIVLHEGKIAEMKTGEGKTLVASLALVLNALAGQGTHLVTVNDYLARRDAGWMAPLYHALGLSVGVIHSPQTGLEGSYVYDPEYQDENHSDPRLQHLRAASRHEAYLADVTYGTNNEFGFDYLRDNMATEAQQKVQRELNYAIVDEVDSILIDEARTPLIISGQGEESTDKYRQYARLASRLKDETDYTIDEKHRTASLTEIGLAKMERWTGIRNIYDLEHVVEAHQVNQAIRAKGLYLRERDYLVQNGEVVIVDEFTGRTMPGRRWSDGLHQAVEAKEGVDVQQEMRTLATITLQNFFRLYPKLAGMTGTAMTEAEELDKIYKLEVVEIPTNRPVERLDSPDVIYKTVDSKFEAVIDEIEQMHEAGRPVLVGTVSVEKSERLARALDKRGIDHEVLNAKQHEREASIVAGAGEQGAVTIATNMAGRGTDIVLGGGVREVGGLHIIGTERHESRRIDNQLRGRAGRQGDPGSTRFFLSLEDDLTRVFGPAADRIGRMMDRFDIEPIEHRWVANSIEGAQKKVEGMHFDDRKHVVEYDDVMNTQRAIIYGERSRVLDGVDTRDNILEYIHEVIATGVAAHCQGRNANSWDTEGLLAYLRQYFPLAEDTELPDDAVRGGTDALTEYLYDAAVAAYKAKEVQVGEEEDLRRQVERFVMLRTIDAKWVDYLTQMEHFREGVGLQAYGQRDPLQEYKIEAHKMFDELTAAIRAEVVANMFRVQVVAHEPPPQAERVDRDSVQGAEAAGTVEREGKPRREPVAAGAGRKIGRNEACPCGSGKKYKYCHGR